uniref:Uncharacterized protein n=1 Tax=Oryza sativa subsp. japonica TaxID=39947 RepID=Q69SX3_ORYSJ|nr:hypothetical protein [Oryza sativa Japonica Group]BAD35959.1 hypothetical protein [Oryza sativa Japonica Group]
MARHSATPAVQQEMLAVGVVARLLFLVQGFSAAERVEGAADGGVQLLCAVLPRAVVVGHRSVHRAGGGREPPHDAWYSGHFDEFAPFEPATARSSPYVPPSPRRRCQQGDETIAWHADGRRAAVHKGAEEETWWGTWGNEG